jgi:hypothetical protein
MDIKNTAHARRLFSMPIILPFLIINSQVIQINNSDWISLKGQFWREASHDRHAKPFFGKLFHCSNKIQSLRGIYIAHSVKALDHIYFFL